MFYDNINRTVNVVTLGVVGIQRRKSVSIVCLVTKLGFIEPFVLRHLWDQSQLCKTDCEAVYLQESGGMVVLITVVWW